MLSLEGIVLKHFSYIIFFIVLLQEKMEIKIYFDLGCVKD